MPELPEVAALAAFLDSRLRGRRIASLQLASFAALKTYAPALDSLRGHVVDDVGRRGKFLLVGTDGGGWLVTHLARAGWVRWHDDVTRLTMPRPGRGVVAMRVTVEGGGAFDLTEQGTEKRLAIYVVNDPSEVPGIARLGVDPLSPELDSDALARLLRAQPGQLKSLLTDQGVLAGIGNAYSDEVLHLARLSPFKRSATLADDELTRLHAALRAVLEAAVLRAADLPAAALKAEKRSGLRVHGRTGQACPACGDLVREVSLGSRSLQYCATCQTGGVPLKDRRLSRLLR
ncbi:MAG: Fpg/Nei family DNA glycosylase [Candidatus Dormibacteria bacterium]